MQKVFDTKAEADHISEGLGIPNRLDLCSPTSSDAHHGGHEQRRELTRLASSASALPLYPFLTQTRTLEGTGCDEGLLT
jgi:hypothetical protein